MRKQSLTFILERENGLHIEPTSALHNLLKIVANLYGTTIHMVRTNTSDNFGAGWIYPRGHPEYVDTLGSDMMIRAFFSLTVPGEGIAFDFDPPLPDDYISEFKEKAGDIFSGVR